MKLFVTILEPTMERAVEAIRAIALDHDGIEVRAENFPSLDVKAIRAATSKPLILTRRGLPFDGAIAEHAIAAGIDFIDIEFDGARASRPQSPGVAPGDQSFIISNPNRVILSFHDFERTPDVDTLAREMRDTGAAHVKIAVTPQTFADNERLLRILRPATDNRQPTTAIGMGERGLYSRLLAPFRGSEILFVAPDDARSAAPGQIDLKRALAIYGTRRDALCAERVFAIAGDPAGRSLSPTIHNAIFRERGVPAAYTVASVAAFGELTEPFLRGEPCGLSVTAPFKEEAYAFAQRSRASIGENARDCEAVNTLVNLGGGRILADNTDVDGFFAILKKARTANSVALVGAGGTARAALVALRRAGLHATIYNRSAAKAELLARRFGVTARPLSALGAFEGDLVIDTTPAGSDLPLPLRAALSVIEAAYGNPILEERHQAFRRAGVTLIEGLDLLRAQAIRQNALFMKVFDES